MLYVKINVLVDAGTDEVPGASLEKIDGKQNRERE